ncbi:MAG: acyl dehydratase [Solirubrobacterales bacterium]|nr:MAG: acyl dehydratase [Solirubrobacterales bacterium]
MRQAGERVHVGGPYFEDFERGQVFAGPAMTLTEGHAALHQAVVGDRMRLALDAALGSAVTGRPEPLAHPNLVCDVSIGQSTEPTFRVRGNLFYRGLVLQRPVHIGDTLRTSTEVVALKQNRPRPDGSCAGLVALRIQTVDQYDRPVLDYWRCPMIPLRVAETQTGHADRLDTIPQELDLEAVRAAIPVDWSFKTARERMPGVHADGLQAGAVYEIEGRDTVTAGPELARLTLNVAKTHTDAGGSAHGRRLVYGGYTIAVAAAQATRALPNLLTILAWRGCDHTGPVFEGDILATELTLDAIDPVQLAGDACAVLDLRAVVHAHRPDATEPAPVLDWRFVGLMA